MLVINLRFQYKYYWKSKIDLKIFRIKRSLKYRFYHPQKLSLIYTIITDRADYLIYDIEPNEKHPSFIWVERNKKSILKIELAEEVVFSHLDFKSVETTFLRCLTLIRSDIKKRKEKIIDEYNTNKKI